MRRYHESNFPQWREILALISILPLRSNFWDATIFIIFKYLVANIDLTRWPLCLVASPSYFATVERFTSAPKP